MGGQPWALAPLTSALGLGHGGCEDTPETPPAASLDLQFASVLTLNPLIKADRSLPGKTNGEKGERQVRQFLWYSGERA